MTKKIHYCWFGGKKLPKSVEKCIKTWKKMLPDYEIKEWNERNFDINSCTFVKEAYESKKWAFVSDYVRIYALYKEGGIYLDTDMKIIKDISNIADKKMFMGYEDSGFFGTAIIGVKEKNNIHIKEILEYYNKLEHFNEEIMYNYANPVIITRLIKKYNSYIDENGIEIFDDSVYIYPRDYFFPLSYDYSEKEFSKNTCAIHLFNATWTSLGERRTIKINRTFGPDMGRFINNLINKTGNLKCKFKNKLKRTYSSARMLYSIHINRGKRVKKIKKEISNIGEDYIIISHPDMKIENKYMYEMFNGNILFLREQYTNKEAMMIAKLIIDAKKELVIFNSYVYGWDKLIINLKKLKRNIKIKEIIYGDNTNLTDELVWNSLNQTIELYDKRKIDKLIFTDENMYEFYKQKEYRVEYLMKCVEVGKFKKAEKGETSCIKFGLYPQNEETTENIYNQLSAISLFDNARVSCNISSYKVSTLSRKYNINLIVNNNNSTEALYYNIANNDINMCINLSNNQSMIPIESLELGTVCLVGNSNNYFKGSELEKYLVVENENDILSIYDKIQYALANKSKIFSLYDAWNTEYRKKSKKSIERILDR